MLGYSLSSSHRHWKIVGILSGGCVVDDADFWMFIWWLRKLTFCFLASCVHSQKSMADILPCAVCMPRLSPTSLPTGNIKTKPPTVT